MARKLLAGAEIARNWTSIAGALNGILSYLGTAIDQPALMGRSGHAFRLAIASSADAGVPSPLSPFLFDYARATDLYAALGWSWESIGVRTGETDYSRRREALIQRIRRSIDQGRPVAAFGLQLNEFGIVNGYDDRVGVLFVSTSLSQQYGTSLPLGQWPAHGQTPMMQVLIPGAPNRVDAAAADRAAIAFAVAYAQTGDAGSPPNVLHGLEAYDRWLEAYERDLPIDPMGNARCIQTLQAARQDAANYLRAVSSSHAAAAGRLEQAADSYALEALALSRLSTLFPYPGSGDSANRGLLMAGASSLREAFTREREAIRCLSDALFAIGAC